MPPATMPFVAQYSEHAPDRAQVEGLPGPTVLEFGVPWCGHCIAAQPLLASALAGRDDVRHLKVEDGRGRPLGRSFRVKHWPTLVLLRDGDEVARLVRPTTLDEVERALLLLAPCAAPRPQSSR